MKVSIRTTACPKVMQRPLISSLAIISLLFIAYTVIAREIGYQDNHIFDDDIKDIWIQHVEQFPVHPKDRYAFHEMGFRTSIYAQTLSSRSTQENVRAKRLEVALYEYLAPTGVAKEFFAQRRRDRSRKRNTQLGHETASIWSNDSRKTRGIVTIAERESLRDVIELVSTLRYSLKVDLPIEIYFSDQEELPEMVEEAFRSMSSVRTINLSLSPFFGSDAMRLKAMKFKRSMALQALALLLSEFDQIIYAAPGSIFLSSPEEMFSEAGYIQTGTLFFHSLNTRQLSDSNRFLNFLRQQFDEGQPSTHLAASPYYNFGLDHQQDSRVLAIDKTRPGAFAALLLNMWLNSPDVRENIWLAHFPEALSETVWLSFELSKAPYFFEPAYPGGVGEYDGPIDDLPWEPAICPAHALHFIGRKSYASRSGRPFWADGGLKLFPGHEKYLTIDAWSARGRWAQTNLGMCLIGANVRQANHYGVGDIYQMHKTIDETFEDIFDPLLTLYNASSLF